MAERTRAANGGKVLQRGITLGRGRKGPRKDGRSYDVWLHGSCMSVDVLFYHLLHQPLETALPKLLLKCLERDWKVVVQTGTPERCAALDAHLWTFAGDSFLPHGTREDGYAEMQPVYLTDGPDNPNGATVRFLVDRATPPPLQGYQRAVYMFDGNDPDALADARALWKTVKTEGFDLTYWQQTESGGWERKA